MQWQDLKGYGVLWIIINLRVLGVEGDCGLLSNGPEKHIQEHLWSIRREFQVSVTYFKVL